MPAVVKNELFLYADDSGILVSGKNKQNIEPLLTVDLNCLRQWLIDNKLSLYLGKTEFILFGSPQKIKCNPSLEIACNNLTIKPTSSVNYLGATLYQTLSFSEMAQSLLKKANAREDCLYRKKQYLTQHTKTTFSNVFNSMPLRLCLLYLVQRFAQSLENDTSNLLLRIS